MGRATWGAPGNRDCAHFFPDGYAADEAQARHHVEVRSHMHVVRQLRARSRTILFRAEDGRGPVALTPRPSEGPGSGEGGKGGEDGAVGAVGPAAPARHKGGEETTGPSRPYTPDSAVLSQPSLPFEEALRVLQQAQEAAHGLGEDDGEEFGEEDGEGLELDEGAEAGIVGGLDDEAFEGTEGDEGLEGERQGVAGGRY